MRPDGTREELNQQKIMYFFYGKGCEIQVETVKHISSYSCRVWWLLDDV
jgi:hypothetical protein